MTDIEMLPLPEALFETGSRRDLFNVAQMEGYARAVAEHNVASRDAEIEALRALLIEACDDGDEADADLLATLERARTAEARAERLAEALRKLAAHIRPTCSVLWDEAQAALRDHDQEGKDG